MPDGVTKVADLARETPFSLAKKTAREYPDSCQPVEIPRRPPEIRCMSREDIDKEKDGDTYKALVSAWNDWQVAYSMAVADLANRLRGALWCYRELNSHPLDAEARGLRDKMRGILREDWGVYDIPLDRFECDELSRMTAVSMARVETRRPEDRGNRAENSNA